MNTCLSSCWIFHWLKRVKQDVEVTCQEFAKWKQVWGEVSPPVGPWLERQCSALSNCNSTFFSTSWHCWPTSAAFTYNSPSHIDPEEKYQKSVFLLSLRTGYLYPKGVLVYGQKVGIGDDLVGLTLPEVSVLAGELSKLSSSCYSVVIINYRDNQPNGLKNKVSSLTKRNTEMSNMFTIISQKLMFSADYVAVVHVLPHLQVNKLKAFLKSHV